MLMQAMMQVMGDSAVCDMSTYIISLGGRPFHPSVVIRPIIRPLIRTDGREGRHHREAFSIHLSRHPSSPAESILWFPILLLLQQPPIQGQRWLVGLSPL